jgi:predicted homoserine dehydrogenase-like protein
MAASPAQRWRTMLATRRPAGVVGAHPRRDVAKDDVVTYDAELPAGRLCDRLRVEQDALARPADESVAA